jgi:hypothetical protein
VKAAGQLLKHWAEFEYFLAGFKFEKVKEACVKFDNIELNHVLLEAFRHYASFALCL